MPMNIRDGVFLSIGVAALVLAWPHAFQWMADGGNILDPVSFFRDAMTPGGTAAFLTIDVLAIWVVFMIWVVGDAARIGLGVKWGVAFALLSYVGVSFAFPVYLIVRDRFLARKSAPGTH
jgi:hypothetical protein